MIVLSKDEYYMLYSHFHLLSEAQKLAREQEKEMMRILKNGAELEGLTNAAYDPLVDSSKVTYEELLSKLGISIAWKPAQNEFSKQLRREEKKSE